MEGLSSAGNIQGAPIDTLIAILKSKSIPNVLKWVDDFVFFCIPSTIPPILHSHTHFQYDYNLSTILSITNLLGIPWPSIQSKGKYLQSMVSYVGFIWSLDNHSVSLSYKICIKYLL